MEALVGTTIAELLKMGGGYVLATVIFILYLYERKDKQRIVQSKDKLYDRLFELSIKQAEASAHTMAVLRDNDKTLDNVTNTLNLLVMDRRKP